MPTKKIILIDELRKGVIRETFENVIVNRNIELLPNSAPGVLERLMDNYVEMVDMLLNYIIFLRTVNCKGYLEVFFDFILYCICLNRQNYAQNLSYYYVHMQALEGENVAAYKYLEQDGFSGSLTG